MGFELILTLLILVGAVVLFATERLPVDVVAMLVLASVMVFGLVTPAEALTGFSSQATVTVAAMFVLSAGLQQTGALRPIGRLLARIRQPWLLTLLVMVMLGGMSAFINNTAALAVFLPIVLAVAAANKFSASKVLIPMSYAAQMGGVCTLIGTSTNLLVHAIARDMGYDGFTMFEFAGLGLICMAVGIAYIMLVGRWILPEHRGEELTATYELGKYITELRVLPESPLIGRSVAEAKLGEKHGIYVLELLRGEEKSWSPRAQKLEVDDVLLVRGDWSKITDLKDRLKLDFEPEFDLRDEQFVDDDQVLAEVMVSPGSRLIGHTLAELEFNWHYNATVLAISRRGQVLREKLKDVRLTIGDILLMIAPEEEMPSLRRNTNIVVMSEREEDPGSKRKGWMAIGVMAAVVAVAGLGLLPIVASAILGCLALVLLRCLDTEEVYEAIDWKVIILLAGILPLGIAMQNTGAASLIAEGTLRAVGSLGPHVVLGMLYFITLVLTSMMSNNAAAVLLAPIAISTAVGMGLDPKPFLVAVTFAASTAFATPVGYQTNTMVYSVGGYRFMDFVKVGTPLNIILLFLTVWLIPRFFPF
ncbi:SLC13 family permease [Alkalisalibacterium limincola]|uniref:Sodium-coupled transporter n=1 Tax=Alkalisalibacterium limincola TaxID=2699169 RepID=A0A5C8KTX9_9GAMM|nr:SLC13 family permease [Alkalisalibacterium limincola]TXK64836.1 sodium-coupled transporter [Alkalisalibacterium limincola]